MTYPSDQGVTPLRWWTSSELDRLTVLLSACRQRWLGAWSALPVARGGVECELAWESALSGGDWSCFGTRAQGSAWLARASDHEIGTILFGNGVELERAPVARSLAAKAASALKVDLCQALGIERTIDCDEEPTELFKPWSGAVIVTLALHGCNLQLLLNAAVVDVLLPATRSVTPSRGALAPLDAALSSRKVQASVRLEALEIDLGTLASIRVGDVLPMAHPLDKPLHLHVDETAICAAFLGRQDDVKAVELVPLTHS